MTKTTTGNRVQLDTATRVSWIFGEKTTINPFPCRKFENIWKDSGYPSSATYYLEGFYLSPEFGVLR